MKPSMLGLLIAAGAFAASTIYLGMQLQEERARADEFLEQSRVLNARVAALERARADLEALLAREVRISNLRIGPHTLDIVLERHEYDVGIDVVRRTGPIEVVAIK
jgi:hypothetical protein